MKLKRQEVVANKSQLTTNINRYSTPLNSIANKSLITIKLKETIACYGYDSFPVSSKPIVFIFFISACPPIDVNRPVARSCVYV